MIESFKSKALKRYWTRGDERGIRPDWLARVRLVLSTLDGATKPEDLDLPDLGFHALTGNLAWRYAVTVSHNWRITFAWEGENATDVELEDYHGASTLRHPSIEPSHPGELLADVVIPATDKSKAEIARLLGVSRQTLYDILNKKQPVTPTVAVKLGKLFGNGAGLWLRMQSAYDLWHAEREVDVSAIPTLKAA